MTTRSAAALNIQDITRDAPQSTGNQTASPFLKWAGGKSRLLQELFKRLPAGVERRRYFEPFVGGGALFFAYAPQRAELADVNPELVNAYEVVRDHVDKLLGGLKKHAKKHNEDHYYQTRARYNQQRRRLSRITRATDFIYLNKTCFNGLHRVNRKGEFNVPMGRYKNPRIADEAGLRRASSALQGANIRCAGYEELLESARPGDFIYLDPPYAPASKTANFTGYATDGFGLDDQARLRDVFSELDRRGAKVMLSNNDVPIVRELYAKFSIDKVMAPRAINRDAKKRGAVAEVIVRNYK